MRLADLPHLNAVLNLLSGLLVIGGLCLVRAGWRRAHGWAMGSAFATSAAFLVSYLSYHAAVGSVRFTGVGWVRPLYFLVLITHSMLAALIVPLVLVTLVLAARRRWETHKRWARVTYPVWLTVSGSGVLVYLMLYHWFASAAGA